MEQHIPGLMCAHDKVLLADGEQCLQQLINMSGEEATQINYHFKKNGLELSIAITGVLGFSDDVSRKLVAAGYRIHLDKRRPGLSENA